MRDGGRHHGVGNWAGRVPQGCVGSECVVATPEAAFSLILCLVELVLSCTVFPHGQRRIRPHGYKIAATIPGITSKHDHVQAKVWVNRWVGSPLFKVKGNFLEILAPTDLP